MFLNQDFSHSHPYSILEETINKAFGKAKSEGNNIGQILSS
jgi:hypothetical protein